MNDGSDENKHGNENENLCRDRPYDLQNIPRRQRLIRILAPLDQAFFNFPLFSDHLTEITILTLEHSTTIQKNINTKLIDI